MVGELVPHYYDDEETNDIIARIKKKWCKEGMIQFDTVIGNPPYSGSLHLDIISSVLPFMSKRATGCFVHPATWLINVRKNGKAKKYDDLKNKLKGHIKSIDVENLNPKFNTTINVPFSKTTIDMNKTYTSIDFTCCGEEKTVNSLYDCNLIGDYKIIWSILEKVQKYGDMMDKHITNKDMGDGYWYIQYNEIVGTAIGNHNIDASSAYMWDSLYDKTSNGEYYNQYTKVAFNTNVEVEISSSIPKRRLAGGGKSKVIRYSDKNADCIYGTKQELENWKHFIFNNKLPLFINIVLTIDQHNNSKEFLPWLVDKQYTDEEINEKFKFTDEEIKLIDDTLKKFERHSPWFKRYMCGKEDPNKVTTMEDSPRGKKKEASIEPDSSPSSSEESPKSDPEVLSAKRLRKSGVKKV